MMETTLMEELRRTVTRCQKLLSGSASGVDTGCDISGMQCRRPFVVGSCISIAAVTVICSQVV